MKAVVQKVDPAASFIEKILTEWVGPDVDSACRAATRFGLLESGGLLGRDCGRELLKAGFDFRGVDSIHWSTVVGQAFPTGRDAVVTHGELRQMFFPANDNEPSDVEGGPPELRFCIPQPLPTPAAGMAEFIAFIKRESAKSKEDLPVIDPREWQGKEVPEREWFVDGWIPSRTVTNLTGDGGSGKTEVILQLIAASSLGLQWFGKPVSAGPCLYYGAEDEADELHRRLKTIVDRSGRQLSELRDVRLIPMAERDAVLAEPDKSGQTVKETILFQKLQQEVEKLRPKLVVIDPAADVFGGDEINRGQVRKFVSSLRSMALKYNCAVVLLSHPSLSGMIQGTGSSGSTAWRNSVRSRLYLMVPTVRSKPDPDVRIIQVQKANHGKTGEEITIRWDNGVYAIDTGTDPVVQNLLDAKIEKQFLELLRIFTGQGQNVGIKSGSSYAPSLMAKHPKGKGVAKDQFAGAMQRLLDSGAIENITEGSPSRQRQRLVETELAATQ